jgi:hypothetical protein
MMEAVSTSEKWVSFYKTTQRNIAEGCHKQLKSRLGALVLFYRYKSICVS